MGFRGPQRKLDSTRGITQFGPGASVVQDPIRTPPGLTRPEKRLFEQLVAGNRAAGVSIRGIDGPLYLELARLMLALEEAAGDVRLQLAIGRRLSELRSELNLGPRNRARSGQPDVAPTAKPVSQVQRILELARTRQG